MLRNSHSRVQWIFRPAFGTWLWGFHDKISCKFFKFLLHVICPSVPKRDNGYKDNNTKYRSLSWKPRSLVGILIKRGLWGAGKVMWPGMFSRYFLLCFVCQIGVTSHYNPVVNMKPITHYSICLYKALQQETGQVGIIDVSVCTLPTQPFAFSVINHNNYNFLKCDWCMINCCILL